MNFLIVGAFAILAFGSIEASLVNYRDNSEWRPIPGNSAILADSIAQLAESYPSHDIPADSLTKLTHVAPLTHHETISTLQSPHAVQNVNIESSYAAAPAYINNLAVPSVLSSALPGPYPVERTNTIYKTIHVDRAVPQPYPVEVIKHVPHPIIVERPVPQPFAVKVHVPKPYPVYIQTNPLDGLHGLSALGSIPLASPLNSVVLPHSNPVLYSGLSEPSILSSSVRSFLPPRYATRSIPFLSHPSEDLISSIIHNAGLDSHFRRDFPAQPKTVVIRRYTKNNSESLLDKFHF